MDFAQGLPGQQRKFVFPGTALVAATAWQALRIPPWARRMLIIGHGGGGNGGNGAVGANSTAAGGGGGGSGGQTTVLIETEFLPDQIYISSGAQGIASRVSLLPDATANHCIMLANGGSNGGNAAGATAGAAGNGGTIATLATCPLAGIGSATFLGGQVGIIGGTTVSAANLSVPANGLFVTGGSGGGGLPAAAAGGTTAGGFNTPAGGLFPPLTAPVGAPNATTPPEMGRSGYSGFNGLDFNYGGTGGGSTHGSATGAGLVGANGGNGGIGCGGGGGGGALTGSTQGLGGRGGPGQVIVIFI